MGAEGDGSEANTIAAGVKVWVPDATEAWAAAEVRSVDGDKVKVLMTAGGGKEEKEVAVADCNLMEKAVEEDMVKLNYLHEPGVLHNLGSRYNLDEIYTYTGSILIAVRHYSIQTASGAFSLSLSLPRRRSRTLFVRLVVEGKKKKHPHHHTW